MKLVAHEAPVACHPGCQPSSPCHARPRRRMVEDLQPHRQARPADRDLRRQHPRHHLGPEHDRSQGRSPRATRSAKAAFASKSIRPATRSKSTCTIRTTTSTSNGATHRVDIIIQMPREGRVNLRTGDGKIDLAGLKGEMDLHSGDGSENLEGVDGKLHASTGDGHITAHGRFDELELKTGDGHVEVRAGARAPRWPRAGASKPATATFPSKSRANSRPTSTCTPATATSISTCPSPPKARSARTKSTASSTAAAAR